MKIIHFTLGITLFLAGCAGGFTPKPDVATKSAPNPTGFDNLSLEIPDGYCLNSDHSSLSDQALFALMDDCNPKAINGFYTLSIRYPSQKGNLRAAASLRNEFSNGGAQSILAAAGLQDEILVGQKSSGNIHYIHTQKTNSTNVPLANSDVWRSFFIKMVRSMPCLSSHPKRRN